MLDAKTLLTQQSFFIGLAPEYIELLAVCASQGHFDAEHYIFREGDNAENFYLLTTGKVLLEFGVTSSNHPVSLETLDSMEALGWSWLFPPYQWKLSARVVESVDVVIFDARCLRALAKGNPAFGYELTRRVAGLMQKRLIRLLSTCKANH